MENYNHIELTEDEIVSAILSAKMQKEKKIEDDKRREAELFRQKLSTERWNMLMAKTFFVGRATKILNATLKKSEPVEFVIDDDNSDVFDLLCAYFNDDESFYQIAKRVGVDNPSLSKGILLAGNFGVGKSILMKTFSQNKKLCFDVHEAKIIANDFSKSERKEIPEEYLVPQKNAIADPGKFSQVYRGLCVDDIGTEKIKNNYGNLAHVIGDLIEMRYSKSYTGAFLHGTTNMSAEELENYYGGRVVSRLSEIFNWIVLDGEDRRKKP